MAGHRVWADIDLAALRRNAERVLERVGPDARMLAVVKADAYGHGAVPVARALAGMPQVWGFGVGDSQEALELRAAGIDGPVLVLGAIIPDEVPQVVSHDVRVCIHSLDRVRSLAAESERQERRTRVHLFVDTGMGRLGAQPVRAADLARACEASPWLELEGLGTHVSATRPGHPFLEEQRRRLDALRDELSAEGIRPPLVHLANTASLLGGEGGDLALVRPGISLYGILTPELSAVAPDIEPVLSLRTQVVYLKDVPAETPIGYNGTFVTTRPTRIATLPVGYNDGLAYRLSNRGRALVRGGVAPIVGAVSMDYTTLDVGHIPDVSVGDVVTLIGTDGDQSISVAELASLIGTIPYEVPCMLGKRVARVYHREPAQPAAPAEPPGPSLDAAPPRVGSDDAGAVAEGAA